MRDSVKTLHPPIKVGGSTHQRRKNRNEPLPTAQFPECKRFGWTWGYHTNKRWLGNIPITSYNCLVLKSLMKLLLDFTLSLQCITFFPLILVVGAALWRKQILIYLIPETIFLLLIFLEFVVDCLNEWFFSALAAGGFALKKQLLDDRRFPKMHLDLQRLLQVVLHSCGSDKIVFFFFFLFSFTEQNCFFLF